jgi:hypothetical protein
MQDRKAVSGLLSALSQRPEKAATFVRLIVNYFFPPRPFFGNLYFSFQGPRLRGKIITRRLKCFTTKTQGHKEAQRKKYLFLGKAKE